MSELRPMIGLAVLLAAACSGGPSEQPVHQADVRERGPEVRTVTASWEDGQIEVVIAWRRTDHEYESPEGRKTKCVAQYTLTNNTGRAIQVHAFGVDLVSEVDAGASVPLDSMEATDLPRGRYFQAGESYTGTLSEGVDTGVLQDIDRLVAKLTFDYSQW